MSIRGHYAVLGYGSLIWDLDDLAPHVQLPWAMGGGPLMPMEFSRVSPKRKMGLVVVLDADNGELCPTHAIASVRSDIHSVAEDLKNREHASSIKQIGALCMESEFVRSGSSRNRTARKTVVHGFWCTRRSMDGFAWQL